MRYAVDTNVMVYAFDSTEAQKHQIAVGVMTQAPLGDCVLIAQCLAEFLNVVRRKQSRYFRDAVQQASLWATTLPVLPTGPDQVIAGGLFADRHKLQLFDSIIWQVARAGQVEVMLSEDMQDGLSLDGLTILNPFNSLNSNALEELLKASES